MSKEWYERPLKVTLPHGGVKAKPNYQLTSLGKSKAENYDMTGAKGEVVTALENIAPATISELSNETKRSPANIKQVVHILIRDGWIRRVTGDE